MTTTVTPPKRITLNPQDRTNVMRAIAFHINGHAIPKQKGDLRLYDRIHSEEFLNNFFQLNADTVNELGQRPDFAFWRTIHDDIIGKEVTLLLVNSLMVKGYLGVNGYAGETFDPKADVLPKTVVFAQMLNEEGEFVVEEIPFISVVAINARLPLDKIPTVNYNDYVTAPVALIDDVQRNQTIIAKRRDENELRNAKRIHTAKRRVKNNAERKARRNNRK